MLLILFFRIWAIIIEHLHSATLVWPDTAPARLASSPHTDF
jgi:hypothetical protein